PSVSQLTPSTTLFRSAHAGTEQELGYPPSWDLGYPASVVLDDGSIWTVYYQVDQDGERPSILGTHWKLEITDPTEADITFRHLKDRKSTRLNSSHVKI